MRLTDCHNIGDFRRLAQKRLPWPVFDYIDGAANDELTKVRNTSAFDDADLVPDVLAGVGTIDTSCTIMGRRSALPLMLSPTALQRAFHRDGERAVAKAANRFGVWFGISSLATHSIEEVAALTSGPKLFQLYVHKDKALNAAMIERCQESGFDALDRGLCVQPQIPPPQSRWPRERGDRQADQHSGLFQHHARHRD